MCPECGKPLVILEFGGIEVDYCPACGGTWLDADDLAEIDAQAGVTAGCLSRMLTVGTTGQGKDDHHHRHCPRCDRHMTEDTLGNENPVRIDRCPNGCGFWYDRGELKRLIACHKDEEEGAVAIFFSEIFRDTLS